MCLRSVAVLFLVAQFSFPTLQAADITLDFAAFQAQGTPLMFGGVGGWNGMPGAPWDGYMAMGLTGIRQHMISGYADLFKGKGLYYIAITNYNNFSTKVPTNWTDYENWMKGSFALVKGKVDGVEVWNEPGPGLLDLGGTPYDNLDWVWQRLGEIYGTTDRSRLPKFTKVETYAIDNWSGNTPAQERDIWIKRFCAYLDIYYHTVRAIRSLDTTVAIGGPAAAGPHVRYLIYGLLGGILTDPRIQRKDVAFASYHTYYPTHRGMNPIYFWRDICREYGRPDLPVYMTEWNQEGGLCGFAQGMQEAAIPFCGQRLSNFFNTGMAGAFHYTMGPADGCWLFYQGSTIAPKSRTWRLMSKTLGLGMGPSTVVRFTDATALALEVRDSLKKCCEDSSTNKFVEPPEYSSVMGAANFQQKPVAVFSNWGNLSREFDVELRGLGGLSGQVPVRVFLASISNDATQPLQTFNATVSNGTFSTHISQPRLSVMGLLVDTAVQPPAPVSVNRPGFALPSRNEPPAAVIRLVAVGRSITVRNVQGPARVRVYTAQGRCVGTWRIDKSGQSIGSSTVRGVGIVAVESGRICATSKIVQ